MVRGDGGDGGDIVEPILRLRASPPVMARTTDDDSALWARATAGDADAFGDLFERHGDRVYAYVARLAGTWTDADDVVGDVFLEAWRQRRRVVLCHGSLLPWLLGVARNRVRRRLRTAVRARARTPRLAVDEVVGGDLGGDADARLDDRRRARAVHARVAALPVAQREVLLLAAWEGLGYEEIATVLAIPVGTVRSRLSRARRALVDADAGTGAALRACLDDPQTATEG